MQTSALALRHAISPSEQFARDGYLIVGPLDFDADAVISAFKTRIGDFGRITDAWRRERCVRRLACDPLILATLAELYGRDMAPFQTLNFARGTEQPIHTDAMFFDSEPAGYMAGVWVALEDISDEAGPLVFYPGSHRLPRLTPFSAGHVPSRGFHYDEHLTPILLGNIAALGLAPRHALLRKGQAMIWHANLAHGGAPIRSAGRSRYTQVTHYMAPGRCVRPIESTPGSTIYSQQTDVRTGRMFGGAPLAVAARELARNLLRRAPLA